MVDSKIAIIILISCILFASNLVKNIESTAIDVQVNDKDNEQIFDGIRKVEEFEGANSKYYGEENDEEKNQIFYGEDNDEEKNQIFYNEENHGKNLRYF